MERQVQRRELNKWQPGSSTLYRREKEKLGANSYRELEAWANRYYHSLPRQRHAEAGTWSSSQHRPDSEKMLSCSTGRLVSAEPNQRHLASTAAPFNQERCDFNNRLRVQLETWKAQQPPLYISAKQSLSRKMSGSNSKENVVQGPSSSQPPNYTPPPPYSSPHGSNGAKSSAEPVVEYRVESRPVASMFPALRRTQHSVLLAEGGQSMDHSSSGGIPRLVTYSDSDKAETLGARRPTQKQDAVPLQPSQNSELSSSDMARSKQNKFTRRRGGETVFCLVSRMGEIAGMSSSPDEPLKSHSLPLLKTSAPGVTAGDAKQVDATTIREREKEAREPVQLADEVDSGGATQPCGPLMTIDTPEGLMEGSQTQISDCGLRDTHEEKLQSGLQPKLLAHNTEKRSFITRKKDEEANAGVKDKTDLSKTDSQAEPYSQTTMMFPLWKEPKWHHCSKGVLEKNNEPNQETSDTVQPGQATEGQPKRAEVVTSAVGDKSRGLVVIDASCVVVKVEFIFPPEKEHVQYVCSRSTDSYEHGSDSLNLQVQTDDHNDTDTPRATDKRPLTKNNPQELHVKIEDQHDHVIKATSEMTHDIMPCKLISKNETLKERAERILGIRFQNNSDEGHTWDEKGNVQKTSLESSALVPIEDSGLSRCENAETSTEEILTIIKDKESQPLKNADGLLEGSEVNLIDVVKTVETQEMVERDVTNQDNNDTSEDNKGMDDNFTAKDTMVDVTQQLKDRFESSPFDEINDKNLLDNSEDKRSYSLGQDGSPREDDPPGETNDITTLCPSLLGDFIEVSSEMLDQEGTLSEGNRSDETDDIRNLCPTFLGDVEDPGEYFDRKSSPNECSSARETEDVNDLCLDLRENMNESFSRESSSRKAKPLNAKSLCPPLPEIYRENTSELLDEGDIANLLDERDAIKNLCAPLFGNNTENTIRSFGPEGTRNEDNLPDETNDMQILCPTPFNNSSELLIAEVRGDANFSDEADGTVDLCPHLFNIYVENPSPSFDDEGASISDNENAIQTICQSLLGSCVGNTSELFIQELGSREDIPSNETDPSLLLENVESINEPFVKEGAARQGTLPETGNIQNVCLSFLRSSLESTNVLLDEAITPRGVTPSHKMDDVNYLCPVFLRNKVENTSDPFDREDAPREVSGERDDMKNLCTTFLDNYVVNSSQLLDQEVGYQDENIRDKTDDLDSSLCNTSMEDTSEFSQENGAPLNKIDDESNLCSPLFDNSMEESRDLLGQVGNEAILPPALHLQIPSERESAWESPLETPLHSLFESPHHLESSLLAASLAGTPDSGHQSSAPSFGPEINKQPLSASFALPDCGNSTLPSPPLTPGTSEGSPQAGEACFVSSSLSVKCGKENQYPKSLWDAVNRIRKHTAPDSENEEEEAGEFWEPMEDTSVETDPKSQERESVLEETMGNLGNENDLKEVGITPDIADSMPRRNSQEEGHLGEMLRILVLSEERLEIEEVSHTGDDTLSSSSLDSHDSKDTVIEGEEDEKLLETDEEDGEV